MSDTPDAPPVNSNYTPPAGYVLVPEAMYNAMVAKYNQDSGAQPTRGSRARGDDKVVYLEVLLPRHLGDIRTQINPGEVLEWVPGKSITIRGKTNNELGSFLCFWNKQDRRARAYDPNFPPVFSVRNPQVLDELLGAEPSARRGVRPRTEGDRIAMEEGRDATRRRVNIGATSPPGPRGRQAAPGFVQAPQPREEDFPEAPTDRLAREEALHNEEPEYEEDLDEVEGAETEPEEELDSHGLPPRGSEARREMIRNLGPERIAAVQRRGTGLPVEDETVENFPVEAGTRDSGRVVATINGPPAEAEEILPLREKNTVPQVRRSGVRRKVRR